MYRKIEDEDSDSEHSEISNTRGSCLSRRWLTTYMLSLGLMIIYSCRVNLSVAIEPMSCEFGWKSSGQGVILSSFFWGYIILQVPGGWLASSSIGAKPVFGVAVAGTALLTFFIPLVSSGKIDGGTPGLTCRCDDSIAKDWCFNEGVYTQNDCGSIKDTCTADEGELLRRYMMIALRVLTGLCESASYPAMFAMLRWWAPEQEKSTMVAISFSGAYLGTLITFPIASILVEARALWCWPSVFYVFGSVGILWALPWFCCISNEPETDPFISKGEEEYIRHSRKTVTLPAFWDIPWRILLTHKNLIAGYVLHWAGNWQLYTFLTFLPIYLDKEIGFDMKKAGFVEVLPYLAIFIVTLVAGVASDHLITSKILTPINTRRLMAFMQTIVCAIGLILCGLTKNATLVIIIMTLANGFLGTSAASYGSNYIDLAPAYSGILYGVSNMFATLPGILSPIVTGFILGKSETGMGKWMLVFAITALINIFGFLFYMIFGSADPIPELARETYQVNKNKE